MYEWILISALLIFVFLLDDLFIDFYALIRGLGPKALPRKKALVNPTAPLAIMVANWKEQDVLESMVKANAHLLQDPNTHIFLGVYPNDLETRHVAEKMAQAYDKVHVVINSANGPTYKGQMLNEIIRFISDFEREQSLEYRGYIIHDAEDLISARSLSLYRQGLAISDFIQLPVYSLPLKLSNLVGGTYLDEFAESHSKDLLVRQDLGVAIPSAGVGTCLSRELIQSFCSENGGDLFVDKDLTEDYVLGMLAHKKGFQSVFSCYYPEEDPQKRVIATREYFPSSIKASIRQKTRWTTGIALQGWKKLGWFGNLRQRYFLWRDRKAIFASALNVNAFFVLVGLSLSPSDELLRDPLIGSLLAFNLLGMGLRLSMRMRWSYAYYGLSHAGLVLIRWPLAVFINSAAGLQSLGEYSHSALFKTELTWKKTEHRFPTDLTFIENEPPASQTPKEISL